MRVYLFCLLIAVLAGAHGAADHHHDHHHHEIHEHDHQEHQGHGERHEHNHEHGSHMEEYNVHKAMVRYVIELTHADVAFDIMDAYMRPLPFLAQSLISTTFISVVPIFLIYAMNMTFMGNETTRESFTYILLSFATGGLLGDVFFHTIPHLSEGHSHSHDHGHGGHSHSEEDMQTNLLIIVGIWVFFLLEKITHTYFSDGHGHDHAHTHTHSAKTADAKKGSAVDKQSVEDAEKQLRYKSFAVISMVGDFIHNFTDGLSIGVSYVADFKMGLVTTMAMFFHEIPHEVGDFAILFQLKYSVWQIVGLQLCTAIGALVGTAIGSVLGQIYLKECLAFTSGGFLYFAINGLMGEIKKVDSLVQLTLCFLSMCLGLYFMYVFALFE